MGRGAQESAVAIRDSQDIVSAPGPPSVLGLHWDLAQDLHLEARRNICGVVGCKGSLILPSWWLWWRDCGQQELGDTSPQWLGSTGARKEAE